MAADMIRLLKCNDCKSTEEVPDFEGPAEYDVLLEHLVQRHRHPNGEEHIGQLLRVERKHWDSPKIKREILSKMWLGTTGFDPEFYASKSTFQEDALKCFNQHQRPSEGCIDWKNSEKRLGNPSKLGWERGPKVYLCDFCPVRAHVAKKVNDAKGIN